MKAFRFLLLGVVLVASVVTSVAATLKGKVIDESTQQPLIGATILIKGTAQGVTTNLDGEFELKVDRKPHTIAVSYISYVTQEVLLEGKGDNKLDILVQLASDTKVMEAVKVTAKLNRESEYAAIADQKDAIFATQVVGAKELSRKGVSDAQGAVAKVSGISKQEGVKNVIVRGLGDRYNATTLNGFPIPSEDPEYKNISLDFFSTDIIQSVIVNKTFTAVGSSDVGGANINITSKELTGDSKFDVSVSGGINTNTVGKDVLVPDGIN
ncbi:MAG: carboxypeptidase-like regulatory domain-containing protein, partial [Rikenellaceae bacterium]